MRNLLSAEIYRCKHNRLFWLMLFTAVLSGVVYGVSSFEGSFDDMFIVPLFVVLAVFISLSVGREYADGTIRNKIIIGKTKTVIFLSKLIMSIAVSVIMVIAFLIPCVAILSANVLSKIPMPILLWTLMGFFLLIITWAVIFTFVSFLISSKGVGGIINFIFIIAIMFVSYQLEFMIGQPEFILNEEVSNELMSQDEVKQVQNGTFEGSYATEIDENGIVAYYKIVMIDNGKQPNPDFVEEPFNSILQSLDSMLPHGQINEYVACLTENAQDYDTAEDYFRIKTFPLYSLFLIVILSGAGMILFRKKEIK